MSRVKEELKSDVRKRFGAGSERIIEYLFDMGTLDDTLARKHMIAATAFDTLLTTTDSELCVDEGMAIRYGVGRLTARRARLG